MHKFRSELQEPFIPICILTPLMNASQKRHVSLCGFMWFSILLYHNTYYMFFFLISTKELNEQAEVRHKVAFYDSSFCHRPVYLSHRTEIQLIYITRATLTPGQFRETVIWTLVRDCSGRTDSSCPVALRVAIKPVVTNYCILSPCYARPIITRTKG